MHSFVLDHGYLRALASLADGQDVGAVAAEAAEVVAGGEVGEVGGMVDVAAHHRHQGPLAGPHQPEHAEPLRRRRKLCMFDFGATHHENSYNLLWF
jgi:deoxycytidylate deaminase